MFRKSMRLGLHACSSHSILTTATCCQFSICNADGALLIRGEKLSFTCLYLGWVHCTSKYNVRRNRAGFAHAQNSVCLCTVFCSFMLSSSSTLQRVKIMCYLSKFAFYRGIFYFPWYYVLPGITFSSCGSSVNVTGFYCVVLYFSYLEVASRSLDGTIE